MFFRSSVLPYAWIKGKLYFGLGLDSRYKEITDFGGRCDFYEPHHLSTAMREYVEETSSPIDFDFESLIAINNECHALHIMRTMPYILSNYIQYISNREITQGFIITVDEFKALVKGQTVKGYNMWDSLAKLILPNLDNLIQTIEQQRDTAPNYTCISDIVTVKESYIWTHSDMLPVAINECNKRWSITDDLDPNTLQVTKQQYLTSNLARPAIRQSTEVAVMAL